MVARLLVSSAVPSTIGACVERFIATSRVNSGTPDLVKGTQPIIVSVNTVASLFLPWRRGMRGTALVLARLHIGRIRDVLCPVTPIFQAISKTRLQEDGITQRATAENHVDTRYALAASLARVPIAEPCFILLRMSGNSVPEIALRGHRGVVATGGFTKTAIAL